MEMYIALLIYFKSSMLPMFVLPVILYIDHAYWQFSHAFGTIWDLMGHMYVYAATHLCSISTKQIMECIMHACVLGVLGRISIL